MRIALALAFLFLGACQGPISSPSELMLEAASFPAVAPADQAVVFIHRPRAGQGHPLYFGIWMDKELIADLGNGHSSWIVTSPGHHTFVGRSAEVKTVVQADLQAGKVYDLWADTAGAWIASFRLKPVKAGDEVRAEIPAWLDEHLIVTLVPRDDATLREFSERLAPKIDVILEEAAAGDLKTYELAATDAR